MKKILTLAFFFAAALAANTASAQQTKTATQDTAKVAPKAPAKDKTPARQQEDKNTKKDTATDGKGTRMAISEQGIPVDKKDKKKTTAKTAPKTTENNKGSEPVAPKKD